MKNKIAFLLGAGVSDPERKLGITTQEVTEKILDGENIFRDGKGKYFYDKKGNLRGNGKEYVSRIKKLLQILRNYFGTHYSFYNREMTYEDYYYLIDSIHNDEWGEIENPVATYFSETLFKTHALLFESILPGYGPLSLIDLTREALMYIKTLVTSLLSVEPNSFTHLDFLKKLKEDSSIERAFIFTLNHDTLIEKYLEKQKVDFSDGFIAENSIGKIWSPESYDNDSKMNLFKLHGSINWDLYEDGDNYKRKVCIYSEPRRGASDPLIIIGSFNKLTEYNSGISFELQYLFWKYINQCDRLIVSGYSFGDLGINSRIINWLYKDPSRKIIIIHEDEEGLLKTAGKEIKNNWKTWQAHNAVKIINKWIQKTNWDEMKKSLL